MTLDLIVGIAGLPGSGKTTFADALSLQIQTTVFSFGDFFRAITAGADLPTFGQEYVSKNTPTKVVDEFLRFSSPTNGGSCIIEGVRHVAIWRELRHRAQSARLVFLDVERNTLIKRLMMRSGVGYQEACLRLNHPVEAEVLRLRDVADILVGPESLDEAIRRVASLIN